MHSCLVANGDWFARQVYPRKYGDRLPHLFIYWTDTKTGNWWLAFGSTLVGYWPASLVPNFRAGASVLQHGGEIVNSRPGGRHTKTDMGSGYFPSAGVKRASYVSNIQYVRKDLKVVGVGRSLSLYATNSKCYSISGNIDSSTNGAGTFILYGGAGYSTSCR
eukprot:SM000015S01172  [mRNA]  locus=s15:163314:164772:- [translate_table: standard]